MLSKKVATSVTGSAAPLPEFVFLIVSPWHGFKTLTIRMDKNRTH